MDRLSKQREFIALMTQEGVPVDVARLVMRHGATLQRLAELECSSEAADRDRVKCPGDYTSGLCLCRDYGAFEDHSRHVATCGQCSRSWCSQCDPAPSALCHYCHGRGRPLFHARAEAGVIPKCSHGRIPRIQVQGDRLQTRVTALLAPYGIKPIFNGDPRGAVVKLQVPSDRTNDWGREGVCVP